MIVWIIWISADRARSERTRYMDRRCAPVGDDDDEETLDLLTKTTGARAAIDHLKKVHDLTHAKPAVAAE